jgi:hypothetical protein
LALVELVEPAAATPFDRAVAPPVLAVPVKFWPVLLALEIVTERLTGLKV